MSALKEAPQRMPCQIDNKLQPPALCLEHVEISTGGPVWVFDAEVIESCSPAVHSVRSVAQQTGANLD